MKVKLKDGTTVCQGIFNFDEVDFESLSFKTVTHEQYLEQQELIKKSYLPELPLFQRIKNKLSGGF